MKGLSITRAVLVNAMTIVLFGAMLSAASTPFESVVIGGLGVLYAVIVFNATTIARMIVAQNRSSVHQTTSIARLMSNNPTANFYFDEMCGCEDCGDV